MRRLSALTIAVAVALTVAVPGVRADGDPASDYLISQRVFLPYDAKIPRLDQQRLTATVQRANEQGFRIRVALIWSTYDLGSLTVLWNKPRLYARFLGVELSYFYKGPLLVVMRNGFGLNPRQSSAQDAALVEKVPIPSTPAGLALAATAAVKKLAAAHGVRVEASPHTVPVASSSRTSDWIEIVGAVAVAVLLGAALNLLVRRRVVRISG